MEAQEQKSAYLCEIANILGSKKHWISEEVDHLMDKLEMTYDVWYGFYLSIYYEAHKMPVNKSYLQELYNLMDDYEKMNNILKAFILKSIADEDKSSEGIA